MICEECGKEHGAVTPEMVAAGHPIATWDDAPEHMKPSVPLGDGRFAAEVRAAQAQATPDLYAIEARAAAATPGPWNTHHNPAREGYRAVMSAGWCVAQVIYDDDRRPSRDEEDDLYSRADAAFIAHARTDVPALCAAVRERDARIGRAFVALRMWEKQAGPGHPLQDAITEAIEALGGYK